MKRPAKPTGMAFEDAARCLAELGHPHRLQIFRLLIKAGDGGLSVGAIQGELGIPKSTLAHHIAQLVAAGLMTQSREGRVQRCRVDAMRGQGLLQFLVTDCCEGLPDLAELQRAGPQPAAPIVRRRAQR
jgi:ArsR family transcriptional regulator